MFNKIESDHPLYHQAIHARFLERIAGEKMAELRLADVIGKIRSLGYIMADEKNAAPGARRRANPQTKMPNPTPRRTPQSPPKPAI